MDPPLTTLTPREGIAGIALLAMHSDGVIAPEEDDAIRSYVASMSPFEGATEPEIAEVLVRLERIARSSGDEALLAMSCAALDQEAARLAFLVAADIIASDGAVALEESEFIVDLQRRLRISDRDARKMLEEIGA